MLMRGNHWEIMKRFAQVVLEIETPGLLMPLE